MGKMTKEEQAIHECYFLLYKNATPSADFDLLLAQAPLNKQGQKVIDFMSYEIEESKFTEIVESVAKKYRFNKYKSKALQFTILMGASPKFKV
jgi:hypothetical protein